MIFKGFHVKRKSPHGDLKQETHRNHPVLLMTGLPPAWPPGCQDARRLAAASGPTYMIIGMICVSINIIIIIIS